MPVKVFAAKGWIYKPQTTDIQMPRYHVSNLSTILANEWQFYIEGCKYNILVYLHEVAIKCP